MKLTLIASLLASAAAFRASAPLPLARARAPMAARATPLSMAMERTYIMIKPDGVQVPNDDPAPLSTPSARGLFLSHPRTCSCRGTFV